MAWLTDDPFDYYATADISLRWTSFGSLNAIEAGTGRNGTNCLLLHSHVAAAYVTKTLAGNYATLISGLALKFLGLGTGYPFLSFLDAGTVHVDLRLDGADRIVVTRNGTVLESTTFAVAGGIWYPIEVKITIGDGTSGSWEVRVNGTVIAKDVGGGDTRNGANAYINQMKICNVLSGEELRVDDFHVCDNSGALNNDFLGDIRGMTQFANADGTYTSWTPSVGDRHDCVNKVAPTADAKYISDLTPGNKCTFSFPALGVTGAVKAVVTNIYALKDDAGSRSIRERCKSGASDVAGGTTWSLSDSGVYYPEVREVDPATTAPWLVDAVDAAEAGVELVS